MKDILGLGLESSCDETAASVVKNGKVILSSIISSQIAIHKKYSGVVPEIASRAHLEAVNHITQEALSQAGIGFRDLDYVAATNRPGLVGSLLIALQSAKAISFSLGIPMIAVNHLEAHMYAPFLEGNDLEYPYIGLMVSGGNTAVYYVKGVGSMECVAGTVDDAAGEAFDKVAKYLNLEYPGGPVIEKLARTAVQRKMLFPKILPQPGDRRFSYSGIKTAVVSYIKENPDADRAEIVYAFQERALELLARRVFEAARERNEKKIVVAGGVSANGRLREILEAGRRRDEKIIIASPVLCTDNGAMVAGIGFCYFKQGRFDSLETDVQSKLPERRYD